MSDKTLIPPKLQIPAALKSVLATLFQDESAVVLVVDKDNPEEILDLRVEPLPDVIALLALNGHGTPVE